MQAVGRPRQALIAVKNRHSSVELDRALSQHGAAQQAAAASPYTARDSEPRITLECVFMTSHFNCNG